MSAERYQPGAHVADRFVIMEKIGEGGMGAVYRALQTSLDREVALKVLHAQNAFTSKARRRFAREARAIARLNHRHIASVYDFGVDDSNQTLWLAMEHVDGPSMNPLRQEPIDLVRVLSLTDQILSALAAAHARGIIHRDMKPSNVLIAQNVDGKEIIKLVDFGLAASTQAALDISNAPGDFGDEEDVPERVILGTPRYMAPEIFKRHPVDPRVDLYALGIMLYELLSGQAPFPGNDPREIMRGHLRRPVPKLVARGGVSLPAEMEQGILKLLEKDPTKRFQSASDAREVFTAVMAQYSYAPWISMGPGADKATFNLGDRSRGGISLSQGAQTIVPMLQGEASSGLGAGAVMAAPLVGRLPERELLQEKLRAALQRSHGSLVFLNGAAGVGKSRLMDWVRVRVQEAGLMRCVSTRVLTSARGFQAVRDILSELFQVQDFPFSGRQQVIEQRLMEWSFSTKEQAVLMQVMFPNEERFSLEDEWKMDSAQTDQERAFALIERVLRVMGQQKPLLLIVDDVHNADETTLAFLEHLAIGMHLSPAPLVVLGAMRREEIEQHERLKQLLARLERFDSQDITNMHLARLNVEESMRMVIGLAQVSEDIARDVALRAEGNPLFISQMVHMLKESKALVFEGNTWTLKDDSVLNQIPDQIADMMRYRIGQVCRRAPNPEVAHDILKRASVLGGQFDATLLWTMLELEGDHTILGAFEDALDAFIRRGIFVEVGHDGEDILAFGHGLMRDALLQEVGLSGHQHALHDFAAQAKIQNQTPHQDSQVLDVLEHYRQSKDWPRVHEYTLLAARAAMGLGNLHDAMELYKQAEELSHRIESVSAETDLSVSSHREVVALEVAHLSRRLGEYETARNAYKRLLGTQNILIGLWARWGLGCLAQRQGDFDESIGWYEAARREALRARQFKQHIDETQVGVIDAHCLYGLGHVTAQRGDLEAATLALGEAVEHAQKLGAKSLELHVVLALAEVIWQRGEVDRAHGYVQGVVATAQGFEGAELHGLGLLSQARMYAKSGKLDLAVRSVTKAQEIAHRLGKLHVVANCMVVWGGIHRTRGANKEAARALRQAHKLYDVFNDRQGLTQCKLLLAQLALSVRRFADAQSLIRDALEGYRLMGDRIGEGWCRMMIGRLEYTLQKYDNARMTFSEVCSVFDGLSDAHSLCLATWLHVMALVRLGDERMETFLSLAMSRWRDTGVVEETLFYALNEILDGLAPENEGVREELEQFRQRLHTQVTSSGQILAE